MLVACTGKHMLFKYGECFAPPSSDDSQKCIKYSEGHFCKVAITFSFDQFRSSKDFREQRGLVPTFLRWNFFLLRATYTVHWQTTNVWPLTSSKLQIFLKAAECKDDILELTIDPNRARSMIKIATKIIKICRRNAYDLWKAVPGNSMESASDQYPWLSLLN